MQPPRPMVSRDGRGWCICIRGVTEVIAQLVAMLEARGRSGLIKSSAQGQGLVAHHALIEVFSKLRRPRVVNGLAGGNGHRDARIQEPFDLWLSGAAVEEDQLQSCL